jgi:hypothetical protein
MVVLTSQKGLYKEDTPVYLGDLGLRGARHEKGPLNRGYLKKVPIRDKVSRYRLRRPYRAKGLLNL